MVKVFLAFEVADDGQVCGSQIRHHNIHNSALNIVNANQQNVFSHWSGKQTFSDRFVFCASKSPPVVISGWYNFLPINYPITPN